MQWQPIETAPKVRGVKILTWGMIPESWGYTPEEWLISVSEWCGNGWASQAGSTYGNSFRPTHWMSLPAPPEQDQRGDAPTTCRWWRDEYGNWCCACSDTMPDFTPWPSADPNGAHCPKCGKAIATKVHDKP